jgi:hypothetical protein
MARKKQIDYLRTEMIVTVTGTVYYHKDTGIKALSQKTNVAGVPFKVTQISDDTFKIVSRGHFPRYALFDHDFLKKTLKDQFGEIREVKLLGRPVKRGSTYTIEYQITDTQLKPLKDWEQSYQSWDLQDISIR